MTKGRAVLPIILCFLAACGQGVGSDSTTDTTSPPETTTISTADQGETLPDPIFAWDGSTDSSTGGVDLLLEGGYEVGGEAISFDGGTGFARTRDTGLIATTNSFSASAWVYPERTQPFMTVISQIGEVAGDFYLGYADDQLGQVGAGEDSWVFSMKTEDSNDPGSTISAVSTAGSPAKKWVHLVGVYDDDASELRLFVNGRLVGVESFEASWQAGGSLTLGAAQRQGVWADFWSGAIADVRVYSLALTDSDVAFIYDAGGPTTDPPSVQLDIEAAFRSGRNQICVEGSNQVAAINGAIIDVQGATPADIAEGLRLVAEEIQGAQLLLDALDVPDSLAEFVTADNARRAERLRLVYELADAFEAEDFEQVDAVDQELTIVNIKTEAAEDANGLRHCP